MELKDFLEADNFYTLSNNAKLLYLYLLVYQDENSLVHCSELISNALHVDGTEFSQLAKVGLIRIGEPGEPIEITR